MEIDKDLIMTTLSAREFKTVGSVADSLNRECYVVGGFVRDIFLKRHSKDIDFVTVGSGIEVAEAVAKAMHGKCSVFQNFGTAQVKARGVELEFVGARKESYQRGSRNPIVEDGTLADDLNRRDFTINAMAISVNSATYGKLLDPFDGLGDMDRRLIRTPLDPDITFSDDPLRMMRAVRFATQLNFDIYSETYDAIERNRERIGIITKERIMDELMKIMASNYPARGFTILNKCGLLSLIFPELTALSGVETVNGRSHKDNFYHTMQVLTNVAEKSDNVWLRWAALLHDIAKPLTKRYDEKLGWTFHNHNFMGEKMVPKIFQKLKLPLNEHMKYVKKLVGLHMRPIALVEETVTDSAVRRLLFEAGDDIDDLMTLCEADITSKNEEKVKKYLENFALVRQKIIDIEEKDRLRNFQPPVSGEEIMETFGLTPSRPVGEIKEAIKEAIIEGVIENDYSQAYNFMLAVAEALGLTPVAKKTAEVHAKVHYHTMQAPVGDLTVPITVAVTDDAVVAVKFDNNLTDIANKLKAELTPAYTELLEHAEAQILEYLIGERKQFDLPVKFAIGTDFQQEVWNSLLTIPYGETISYKMQAERVGRADALRAVASANGANPLCIIYPCHRVLGSRSDLGGYVGGVEVKKALLEIEKAHKND